MTGYDELVVRTFEVANCDLKFGDEVRAELTELGLKDADVADAVAWSQNSEKPAAKA